MSFPHDAPFPGEQPRPYPPARYTGDTGEVSATIRRAGAAPDLVYDNGGTVDYLATGAGTGGDFGLYRWNFSGPEAGPDPHFHRTMSESFFVLDGRVDIHDGTDWVSCSSGDYVFVPPGGLHGFKNRSGEAASMLLLFTPGAHREPYFETLAEFARGLTMTADERAAFLLAHDNHFAG